MPQAKTEVALQFSECCAAEVALQHSLFCSANVILTKSCAAANEKLHCNIAKAALQESGAFLPLSCGFQAPTFRHPPLGLAEQSQSLPIFDRKFALARCCRKTGKSTLWTNTGQDRNLQRTLRAIGPYLFPGKCIWTNHWSIPFPGQIRMEQWSGKFFKSFPLHWYWSMDDSSQQKERFSRNSIAKKRSQSLPEGPGRIKFTTPY